jgi:HAD superfamily hydrolase (TIGR01509 family)
MEKIVVGEIEGIILDMHGLLLDTERISKKAWQKAAHEFGYTLTDKIYLACLGKSSRDHEPIMQAALGDAFPLSKVKERRLNLVSEHFQKYGVPLKPGAATLVELIKSLEIPVCIATATVKNKALELLHSSGIFIYITDVVGGDDVECGKPAPDIYLFAAKKIGVIPERCLVFEDSEAGLFAASAAGMRVILVPDLKQPSIESRKRALKILKSLEGLLLTKETEGLSLSLSQKKDTTHKKEPVKHSGRS